MISKYISEQGFLKETNETIPGMWINLTAPTQEEILEISKQFDIDLSDVRAALDEEESSRVDVNDGYVLIIFDIPTVEIRHNQEAYTTIPLGIIWAGDVTITVCSVETPVLKHFLVNTIRNFTTKKQVRFTYQILYRTSTLYQSYLRIIDRRRLEMEERMGGATEDADIINLHEMESNLVYFDTSLRANRLIVDRLTRYSGVKKFPEDQELLDDLIIENQQAIEMTQIYRDILKGTRELMTTIINNRLNNIMKYLASITIVMAIPTIISGLFGMNVDGRWMPFSTTPFGFGIICGITALICAIVLVVLRKRKML
ncbi:MAG: magnesium transporter CorA family protein [Clostridium sp.]|nr:magnesium transporter CorA family protein [Clostridium sp.]MCM1171256.1 magnesium transporter CorA family protein [Clostridium sp.]MCM1209665.1 magnesium transporter CorA family protein [Ruminococcus sp.]